MSPSENFDFSDILKQHSIIEASAGTGKTYSIVKMVRILLEEQGSELSEILLLTYTNKATLELKNRMHQELYQAYEEEQVETKKQQYLKWIRDLPLLSVYTIHGFLHRCVPILDTYKQFPLTSKENEQEEDLKYLKRGEELFFQLVKGNIQKPFFEGMEKEQIDFLLNLSDPGKKQWDSVFHKSVKYNRPSQKIKKKDSFLELIKQYDQILCLDGQTIKPQFSLQLVNKESFEKIIQNIMTDFKEVDLSTLFEKNPRSNESARTLHSILENVLDMENQKEIIKQWVKFSPEKLIKLSKIRDYKNLGLECLLEPLQKIHELSQQILLYLVHCIVREMTETNFVEYGFKGKLHLSNFLAFHAQKNPEVLKKIKFSHVFIDEFQDTNVLEWETLKLLFLKNPTLSPKILIIGDPKQAIYKFKGSDINAYQKAKVDLLTIGGKQYILKDNYRSEKKLLNSFNQLFENQDYFGNRYQQLSSGLKDKNDTLSISPNIVLLQVKAEGKKEGKPKLEFNEEDLKQIAKEYSNRIREDKTKWGSDIKIAILARKNKHLKLLKQHLEEQNIPCFYYNQKELFQSIQAKQVKILFYALKKESTHLDNILALQTPFFNTQSDIQNVKKDNPLEYVKGYQKLRLYRELAKKKQWALLRIELLVNGDLKKNVLPKDYKIFQQILDEIIFFVYERQENIDKLLEYIEYLSMQEQKNSPENTYQISENNTNTVELLTVHASKGLEFDIVYLFLNFKKDEVKYPYVFKSLEDGHYRSFIAVDGENLSENSIEHAQKEIQEENKNLFYVALTRAKHQIVMAYPADNTSFLVSSLKTLKKEDNVLDVNLDLQNTQEFLDTTVVQNPEIQQDKVDIVEIPVKSFRERTWQMLSYTSLSKLKQLSKPDTSINPVVEPIKTEGGVPILLPPGKNTGIFLHTLIENIRWIWIRYHGDLSLYVQEMMKKYSFTDVPIQIFCGLLQKGLGAITKTKEGKNLLKDSILRSFLLYCHNLGLSVVDYQKQLASYKTGIFHGEFVNLLGILLDLTLIGQKNTIKELIFQHSSQEMTLSFQVSKAVSSKYIESTLDMVFIGEDQKIYFLDWKTDILGSYETDFLKEYTDRQYSLQWKLYLIAIEGFLKTYLQDFDYNTHIGGFYYVFVRGVHTKEQGVYYKTAPSIKELDTIKQEIGHLIN